MADNFTLNNTNVSGGPTYRDLDRAGVRTQVVQLDLGGAASEVLAAGTVPVSGAVSVGNFPATQAVSGPVTDAQLRATALAISGTVNTGGLTDTQLRATAVAMSAASLPLPTGAGTEATLAGVRTDLGTDGTTPPAVLGAGTGVRGWLRSIYEKLTGTLAVTGTFFQATQPVSGPVTDTQLRATAIPISGTVTANAGTGTLAVSLATAPTTPVTGTFWQPTQPVSLATLPVTNAGTFAVQATLAAETTKVIGTINIAASQTVAAVTAITNALPTGANVIGALSANQSVNTAQIAGVATAVGSGVSGTGVQRVVLATDVILPAMSEMRSATLHVTATAAANTAATASLPAAGVGLFHYITNITLMRNATAALAGTATLIHTSTNLPGSPAWSVGNAMAAGGTQTDLNYSPATPLRSAVANTITTVVMAAGGAAVLNRVNVSYFTAA